MAEATQRPDEVTMRADEVTRRSDVENRRSDVENRRPVIYLYTDGAASGNPGPGGYGAVLKCNGAVKELSGGFARTTNNRMELLAVIKGLEAIRWQNATIEVWSDSTYVVKAITDGWLMNWERKGFKKVKNVDLWTRFIPLYRAHQVTFHWIKGHAGHPENERCDALAVAAYKQQGLPADEGYTETSEGSDDTLFREGQ